MENLILRVKSKFGDKVINNLALTDDVLKLKLNLSELTGINIENLHILNGFPPKPLKLTDNKLILKNIGLVSGDTLIVEEKKKCNDSQDVDQVPNINDINRENNDNELVTNIEGKLLKQIVPADNSCLFTSIGYVISGKVNPNCSGFMREVIANEVANDKEQYNEAILNKPNNEYCNWILKSDSWGGAIELSILSRFYGMEIVVVNSLNGNINRFGEDQHYDLRVFLLFDGIHYDPLYYRNHNNGSIKTMFSKTDENVLLAATQLAKEANSTRQFTNVDKFTLKCMDCNIYISGQIAATQHAKETGHTNFGEVNS